MPTAVAMRMTVFVTVMVRMPVVVVVAMIVRLTLVPRRGASALARVLAAAPASLCVSMRALRATTLRRAALLLSLVSHWLGPMDYR